jgi:hypothetical protein
MLPYSRYGNFSGGMLRFVVIKFVVINYWWWIRLLLLLKPAEAKEEYVGSYSIVFTNSIGLAKNIIRYYKLDMIAENAHKSLVLGQQHAEAHHHQIRHHGLLVVRRVRRVVLHRPHQQHHPSGRMRSFLNH